MVTKILEAHRSVGLLWQGFGYLLEVFASEIIRSLCPRPPALPVYADIYSTAAEEPCWIRSRAESLKFLHFVATRINNL